MMYLQPSGRGYACQTGNHNDDMLDGKYNLEEGYYIEVSRQIKPSLGSTPLLLVGGMRTVAHMETALDKQEAEVISMSRRFIREPFPVERITDGKLDRVACVSCNRCLVAVVNGVPVHCYHKGLPE